MANARRNSAYGAASSHPARSSTGLTARASARINDLPRLGRRAAQGLPNGDGAVHRRFLVGLRHDIEDLDYVRVEVEIARALDVPGERRERRPPRKRRREPWVAGQAATVRQLARLLDQQAVGGRGCEKRDESRGSIRVSRGREDGDAAEVREGVAVAR